MLARVYACTVIGLEGLVVDVEVGYGQGLPGTTIVGLPDAAVQESRERVYMAIKNAGLFFPSRKRLIVNLASRVRRNAMPSSRSQPSTMQVIQPSSPVVVVGPVATCRLFPRTAARNPVTTAVDSP